MARSSKVMEKALNLGVFTTRLEDRTSVWHTIVLSVRPI
jgi:hypothetical protein